MVKPEAVAGCRDRWKLPRASRLFGVSLWTVVALAAILLQAWGADSIPWGAMYTPAASMTEKAMTGTVGFYRGRGGVARLLADLTSARRGKVKMILTQGTVNPSVYADAHDNIDMAKVKEELSPHGWPVLGRTMTPWSG